MDIGCLVENVGTTVALWNAVVKGWPLDERTVTVTGPGVAAPRNLTTRVGVSFAALVEACGGLKDHVAKVIAGGPMMGFAQHTLDVSVSKTTSGILVLRAADVRSYTSQACIGCGRCNEDCPMRLLPSELAQCIEADDIPSAEAFNLMDCFECGACAYVCPSRRPLVQHMRRAKAAVMLKRRLEKAKP
jgi:electron transport complex protein RnfC